MLIDYLLRDCSTLMHVWEYSTAYLSFPVLSKLWKERAQAELSSGNSVVYPARARANPHSVKHNTSTCHPVMQGPVGVAEVHALWWRGLVKVDMLTYTHVTHTYTHKQTHTSKHTHSSPHASTYSHKHHTYTTLSHHTPVQVHG